MNPTTPRALVRAAAAATLGDAAADLDKRRGEAVAGPSAEATATQHRKGKLTARERLDLLFDEGSFQEIGLFRQHRARGFGIEHRRPETDGVVTGWGLVGGRHVFAYAHDFRIFGGSLGEAHAEKIHKLLDLAEQTGAPVVAVCDGAGARIQEGVRALAGYGGIFRRNVRCSGVIPQISVVIGPCAGGAAYSPALTDFVFVVEGSSQMFVTGPDVVRSVTGEDVDEDALGGGRVHASSSGVAAFVHPDETGCFAAVRELLGFLPDNSRCLPPERPCTDPPGRPAPELLDLVPANTRAPYDMVDVVVEIVDDGEFLQVHERWAPNIVCLFARLDGQVVGFVASQPCHLAGAIDIAASEKAARFVQFCDAFNIPLVTVVDVPGFLPGVDQEHNGIIRHGAKLLYAYCNATVPRIQLVLRKAYGGAYIVMDSGSIGADICLAWPGNEIAVMGAEAAADVVFRREIADSSSPDEVRQKRVQEYRETLMHPYHSAQEGFIDELIDPTRTRETLVEAMAMLRRKDSPLPNRKHGNQPQ